MKKYNEEFIQLTKETARLNKIRNSLRQEAHLIQKKIWKPQGIFYWWTIQCYYSDKTKEYRIEKKFRALNSLKAGYILEAQAIDDKLQQMVKKRRKLLFQIA